MRKIKFRAKSKLTNEWLYSCMILQTGSPNVQFIARLDENHKIDLELIKPETLGEFTGLQDADGKDIYEGDIVLFYGFGRTILNVHFENSAFGVGGKNGLPKRAGDAFTLLSDLVKVEKVYVVGNIHDNPDLLKEVD